MGNISMEQHIANAEEHLIHTYNRYQIVLDHGKDVHLYDINGKEYLDFVSGIAVFALGYGNQEYNDALKAQIDKILHVSNYFYSVPMEEAAKKVTQAAGMDKVFFTNSGAEAIEGAIKLARKVAYLKNPGQETEILAMDHSFHGRTTGALAVTGNPKYREAFAPLMNGVVFAEFNNLEDVRSKITDKTAAILMETVQGEGGIYPATKEFIEGVRRLCDEKGILMISDEIQCGMGRSGKMFAYQQYGIEPDIVTCAKALGCGVPVGAFMAKKEVAEKLVAGDHGSTYGGNPLVCAAINKVFDLFEKEKVLENVNEVAPYLVEKLSEIAGKYDFIKEQRGMGLMQCLEFDRPVGDIIKKAMDKGLILISAGANIIRFLPSLVIRREHVDEMAKILCEVLDGEK